MATSILEAIHDGLVAEFEAIQEPTYRTSVYEVRRIAPHISEITQFPTIAVELGEEMIETIGSVANMFRSDITVHVYGYVSGRSETELASNAYTLAHDMKQVVAALYDKNLTATAKWSVKRPGNGGTLMFDTALFSKDLKGWVYATFAIRVMAEGATFS
jgi:hypothetical protein